MAKKSKSTLLTELKQGDNRFSAIGKAKIGENSLKGAQQKEGKTWRHVRSSIGVEAENGNVIYPRIEGGYKTDKPILYTFNEDNELLQIDYDKRFDKDIIKSVRRSEFFVARIEKDDEGKLITKTFLSPIDFEEYLAEHLENDMDVRVYGEAKYNEWNDAIQKNWHLKGISLNEEYKNQQGELVPKADPMTKLVQTFLLDNNSLPKDYEKKLEKDGCVTLLAAVPQYVGSVKMGESFVDVKKTLPLRVGLKIIVEEKTEDEIDKKKRYIEKFIKTKKGVVRELVGVCKINEGYDEAKGEVKITKEMKELIELGIMTKEEVESDVTVRGNRVSDIVLIRPYSKRTDAGLQLAINDDKYDPSVMIAPVIEGEDEDLEDDDFFEEEDEKEEDSKQAEPEKDEDEDDPFGDEMFD